MASCLKWRIRSSQSRKNNQFSGFMPFTYKSQNSGMAISHADWVQGLRLLYPNKLCSGLLLISYYKQFIILNKFLLSFTLLRS